MTTAPSRPHHVEIPTVLVAFFIYGGWVALTWWPAALPGWALASGGGWLIAWQGSLQHETIHGHPSGRRWFDTLAGAAPLSLWLPYVVYRRTHLAHHRIEAITDPFDDPESRYISAREGRTRRLIGCLESPLLGRLLLGPFFTVARFLVAEFARMRRGPSAVAKDWLPHLAGVTAILLWLHVCGFGFGRYALYCVYPGLAMTLLRSFAEHRADAAPSHRVATVEGAGPLALLYLNNNLHAAHHRAPGVAWFALPAYYRRQREALLADNQGLLYRSYGEVAARFLLRPHDRLVHPDHV